MEGFFFDNQILQKVEVIVGSLILSYRIINLKVQYLMRCVYFGMANVKCLLGD